MGLATEGIIFEPAAIPGDAPPVETEHPARGSPTLDTVMPRLPSVDPRVAERG